MEAMRCLKRHLARRLYRLLQQRPALGVDSAAGDRDDVQSTVDLAIAATIQAVTIGTAGDTGIGATPESRAKWTSLLNRSAPAVCPIKIAAVSGPQPVSSSNSGRCTRMRSRKSRLSNGSLVPHRVASRRY